MAKVRTFSRVFPAHHSFKGINTYFVQKLLKCWYDQQIITIEKVIDIGRDLDLDRLQHIDIAQRYLKWINPKLHTIRSGQHFKSGDIISPRVWLGDPYNSKQYTLLPELELKTVLDFKIEVKKEYKCILIDGQVFYEENGIYTTQEEELRLLAKNDGLTLPDFKEWFKWPKAFEGQLLSWVKMDLTSVEITNCVKL